jgi:hypothetical protein
LRYDQVLGVSYLGFHVYVSLLLELALCAEEDERRGAPDLRVVLSRGEEGGSLSDLEKRRKKEAPRW